MIRITPKISVALAAQKAHEQNRIYFKGNGATDTFEKSGDAILAELAMKDAEFALKSKDYGRAITKGSEAVNKDPKSALARTLRGRIYEEMGQPDNAITDYNEAIKLAPNEPKNYNLRAHAKTRLAIKTQNKKMLDEARADYDKSLSLKKTGETYDSKGVVQMIAGDFKEAISTFDLAIADFEGRFKKDPSNSAIKHKLGDLHYKKGRSLSILAITHKGSRNYDEAAKQEFTKSIELAPDISTSYFERAKINFKTNFQAARADIEKALDLEPLNGNYRALRDEIKEAQSKFETVKQKSSLPDSILEDLRRQGIIG